MKHFRQKLNRELQIWRIGALPGLLVIALVLLARFAGGLQNAEWFALDSLLRSRPAESIDDRILVVGINEADIRQIKTYPIPDRQIARLLQTLQQHQPSAIGLDIFRDLPVQPGHAELEQAFQAPNLFGIERTVNAPIPPPPALPTDRVGFADSVLDRDGYLRRSLLAISMPDGGIKFSLTVRLAERYLTARGIPLDNGIRDPIAMRFGAVELPRFLPNSGGYRRADAGGVQTLLNFRSGKPFRVVAMRDVLAGEVPDHWIHDRIVLVGTTAPSVMDVVNTAAISGNSPGLPGLVNGVEIQAHAVSQIVSAVLDRRPLLNVWSEPGEYLWIVAWGLLGIGLGRVFRSPLKLIAAVGAACLLLVSLCGGLLLIGWWVPLVPAFLAVFLNGAGLTALLFYRHEQDLRAKLRDRQFVIDQTFNVIHNGPLQTLARMLRSQDPQQGDSLYPDLKLLNEELRAVYESVRQETVVQDDRFYLGNELELDLNTPTCEVLYEVYTYTLSRDFPCFHSLKLTVTAFEEIDDRLLTADQKRGLYRFLEEALCNVGKHAVGVTQLDVISKLERGKNYVCVIDNGIGLGSNSDISTHAAKGRGTQQARELARQLGGQFRRSANHPQGTICEVTWSAIKPWWRV